MDGAGSNTQRNSARAENGTPLIPALITRQLMDYFYFQIEYAIPAYYPPPPPPLRVL